MRYLLLGDLHANLEATRAVLESALSHGYDRVVMLGDLVGYGGSPDEVVTAVRELEPVAMVRGNHDKVVAGIETGEDFNLVAREAARINRGQLSETNRRFLSELPRGPIRVDDIFLIAHGTPLHEDEYLVEERTASAVFEQAEFPLCFFGHTHLPGAFVHHQDRVMGVSPDHQEASLVFEETARYLINPGSVGQPRDENPRAGYAIYDHESRKVTLHRIDYPISGAQSRILEAGLPPILAERLAHGI